MPPRERSGAAAGPSPSGPSRSGPPRSDARADPRPVPPAGPIFAWLPPRPALEAAAAAPWALPAVLAVGLAFRLAHLLALHRSPFFTSLVLDARYYDAWAQQIAGGAWIGKAPFWVDPLYAYVLGGLYAVVGHGLLLPRILNIAFGVATGWLVARLAQRMWQSHVAGLIAAFLAVTCIPTIYFEGQLEKTALTVILVAAAAWACVARSLPALALAGVVTGLAALARGNALLFAPFIALCLLFDPEAPGRGLRRAGVFLAAMLPLICLATLHNWLAAGVFVPTTTNLGVNLYLGNHSGNLYGYYWPPDFLHPDTGSELPDFRAEAQRRTGRALPDDELSAYWTGQALAAVEADPAAAIVRTVHKLQLTIHDDEVPDNEDVTMVGEWSPVLRSPLFWIGHLLAIGLLGAVVGWGRRPVRILIGMTAIYLASLLPFFVMARLRVQIVPLLAILGGGAIVWLVEAIRLRDRRRLVAASALVVPALFLSFYRPDWMAERRTSSLAIAWNNLGETLRNAGKTDEAIHAYERAVGIKDEAVPIALRTLGDLYRGKGDFLRAETAMRRVLELKPNSRLGADALRNLYAAMQADPRWRDDPVIRSRAQALGQAPAAPGSAPDPVRAATAEARSLGKQGRFDDAIRVLQDAVKKGPYDEGLHYFLGETMERHADPDAMIRFFSEELARDEKPQTSQYFWAVGLARKGDVDGAIAHLRKALEIDPAHEMSHRQWGLLLERQGRLAEALEHFAEAARIHPDFRAALEDAARVAAALGRTAEAEDYRRRAASADPNSIRRFVHWARYLHEHGRNEAAWAEIQRMLRERPADPEALALRDQIRAALGDKAPAEPPASASGMAASARAALVAGLASQSNASAWIAYDKVDPGAERLAKELAAAFEEARWKVRGLERLTFGVRPGIFLFVGGEPSARTEAIGGALDRAGFTHVLGTAYREYADEHRGDASWQGVRLAADQEFVLVVGRQPAAQ